MMNVMIVVTHLLGTGHLARALTLGRAFAAAGDQVSVVSGGAPVPHFDAGGMALVQLPPVRSNGTDFTALLRADGNVADAGYMGTRRDMLHSALAQTAPDVLITELFPFGRRILRDEFRTLLEQARAMVPAPLILASIRDILAPPGKSAKASFADEMVARFYDGVLVHSDPELVRLERSWPVSARLEQHLHYTGFVAPAPPAENAAAHDTILVSAGGGTVGDTVFAAAMSAAALMPDRNWLFLVGGDDARRERLAAHAPPQVRIHPPRRDFRNLLHGAAASVSMCGYNTAMDVLQTGVPSVLIPFDDGGEVEQGLRAEALAVQPGIAVLWQDELEGRTLVAALQDVCTAAPRPARRSGMDGARATVNIAHEMRARPGQ